MSFLESMGIEKQMNPSHLNLLRLNGVHTSVSVGTTVSTVWAEIVMHTLFSESWFILGLQGKLVYASTPKIICIFT